MQLLFPSTQKGDVKIVCVANSRCMTNIPFYRIFHQIDAEDWGTWFFWVLKVQGKSNSKLKSYADLSNSSGNTKFLLRHENIPDFYSHWLCYLNIPLTLLNEFPSSVIFSSYWNSQKKHYFSISKNQTENPIRQWRWIKENSMKAYVKGSSLKVR